MEYVANKDNIAKRIARIFKSGDVVNLGIGLPTLDPNRREGFGGKIVGQGDSGEAVDRALPRAADRTAGEDETQ